MRTKDGTGGIRMFAKELILQFNRNCMFKNVATIILHYLDSRDIYEFGNISNKC